jgi:glycine cleavage system transcriptional repressor
MDQLAAIILYATDNEITAALFESIAISECQQVDIRLSRIGADYQTATLILSGNWNQLTRFKTRFSILQKQYTLQAILQDICQTTYTPGTLPYQAYITTPSSPEGLYHAVQFFLGLPIALHELSIKTYQAPVTHTAMLEISLLFMTPPKKAVSDYRESILAFCDENNFEVILEPKRD